MRAILFLIHRRRFQFDGLFSLYDGLAGLAPSRTREVLMIYFLCRCFILSYRAIIVFGIVMGTRAVYTKANTSVNKCGKVGRTMDSDYQG